jgi:hypothetical protein
VAGRVASFTVNGVPVGQGLSDENGFFHGLWSVPLPAGMGPGFYPETIVGTFAGDDEYTPSVGSGDIRVVACAPPPPVVKPPAKKPARPHKKPAKKKW